MKKLLLILSYITYIFSPQTEEIKVYTSIDIVTKSPHNIKEFYEAIEENKDYLNYNGNNILMEFIVDENGKLLNATILKGIDVKSDSIALKIINETPYWIQGFQKYHPIIQKFVLPISIKQWEESNTPF